MGAEGHWPGGSTGQVLDLLEDRIGLTVEFQGGLVGEDRVIGHLRSQEVGVHGSGGRIGARWHHAVQASAHTQDPALLLG